MGKRRIPGDQPRPRPLRRAAAVLVVGVAAVAGGYAASRPAQPPPRDERAVERLRAHLGFLADDLLDGRFTGTPSYEIAARYVASHFRQLGLEPLGAGGSYLLPVPLESASVDPASARCDIVVADRREPLTFPDGFAVEGDTLHDESAVIAPVVFVGYGISAPELGWDDYQGLDVRGKLVLVMSGSPKKFPHDQRAYHGGSRMKRRRAAEHGASGVLTFRTAEDAARVPWERIARNAGKRPSMAWLEPDGSQHGVSPEILAVAALSDTGVAALLAAAGKSVVDTVAATQSPGKGFELAVTVDLAYHSQRQRIQSSNVAAMLRGSDPALAAQSVVVSAHLDHLGEGAAVDGDAIYNGFYDNAMGSSLMLETARALASARERPRRSVIFLAVTGEERGLLGSSYFASRPPAGAGKIVADVNLDMPLFLFPVTDLVAFGAEHSTIAAPADRSARLGGFRLVPDPMPDEVIFVRSDQYSFVERGVPSVFLVPGFGSSDAHVDGEKAVSGFRSTHYHQPSDDARLPVDWPSAVRFLQSNVALARELASADAAPAWNPGDFFGATFGGDGRSAPIAAPARRLER
jgi:peptidase M28-like protein